MQLIWGGDARGQLGDTILSEYLSGQTRRQRDPSPVVLKPLFFIFFTNLSKPLSERYFAIFGVHLGCSIGYDITILVAI